jgi:hypothetical protein
MDVPKIDLHLPENSVSEDDLQVFGEILLKGEELSRHLRTFFNYRGILIRFLFSDPQETKLLPNRGKFLKKKEKFFMKCKEFYKVLNRVEKEGDISERIWRLKEKAYLFPKNIEAALLKKISVLTQHSWILLHELSELEVHHEPELLGFLLNFAAVLCEVSQELKKIFSLFYRELNHNYVKLYEDFSKVYITEKSKKDELKHMTRKERVAA